MIVSQWPGACDDVIQPAMLLDERFLDAAVDPRLEWLHAPLRWASGAGLVVEPPGASDYWAKTAYGFEAANGPALVARAEGDFVLSTRVRLRPVHQYDQAGLLVYCSDACWLKTSVEYEAEGPSQLGAVVTNRGYSDWSLQDFPAGMDELELRVRMRGGDCLVEFRTGGAWKHLRVARLEEWTSARVGVYACCPKEAGFRAEFQYLRVETFPAEVGFFSSF